MSFKTTSRALIATLTLSLGLPISLGFADEAAEREFTLKVLPLLKDKCLGCHGGDADDIKGEFSVITRDDLLRGGESEEPAIVPGEAEQSLMIQSIRYGGDYEMRPKGKLPSGEVDLLTNNGCTCRTAPFERHVLCLKIIAIQEALPGNLMESAAPVMRPTQRSGVCVRGIDQILHRLERAVGGHNHGRG